MVNSKKLIISIEGNIGVGKTSIIELLKNNLSNEAEFIYEPVEEWMAIKDKSGKNLLETFYGDKKRWSYTFQNVTYITRMNNIVDKINNSEKKIIILDRSLSADLNTFAKMLYDDGFMDDIEWNAYNKWNNFFDLNYGNKINHKIIYLRCNPETSQMRIKIRNRGEENNIPLDYLETLHKYHDNWLVNNSNALIIDADKDFVNNKNRFDEIYDEINNFIKNN
jgi:deoxyadenosine/deoxycytidine kinase